jgi:hypothetical protein
MWRSGINLNVQTFDCLCFMWIGTAEDRRFTYISNIEARSHNYCCRGKAINIY